MLTVGCSHAPQEAFLTPSSVAIVLEHADAGDLSRHVASHCDPLVCAGVLTAMLRAAELNCQQRCVLVATFAQCWHDTFVESGLWLGVLELGSASHAGTFNRLHSSK
jgi:hypothetical protein